jgi:hypothetical protein
MKSKKFKPFLGLYVRDSWNIQLDNPYNLPKVGSVVKVTDTMINGTYYHIKGCHIGLEVNDVIRATKNTLRFYGIKT